MILILKNHQYDEIRKITKKFLKVTKDDEKTTIYLFNSVNFLLFFKNVKGGSTSNVSKFIILTVKKGT
jgi:hypothetical protein